MKVMLKRDWFTSRGRFRVRDNPVTVPNDLRPQLPTDAVVVGDNARAAAPQEGPTSLRDFDEARASAEAFERVARMKDAAAGGISAEERAEERAKIEKKVRADLQAEVEEKVRAEMKAEEEERARRAAEFRKQLEAEEADKSAPEEESDEVSRDTTSDDEGAAVRPGRRTPRRARR